MQYKEEITFHYAPVSVNSMLSSLNSFFVFLRWHACKVKTLNQQKRLFSDSERELTKTEYERLLRTAEKCGNERLCLIMQTICSCGIRVSELKFITAEAIGHQYAEIRCKGKERRVLLPKELCRILKDYLRKQNRKSGPVFVTKGGKPLDRSNIWSEMKKLCRMAMVSGKKVFPHNLRHLFARTYYSIQKDIVRLADLLGHSSVHTTRIYTMESGEVHRKQIQRLGLLYCRSTT